uniref:DNA ligase 4 n=1 Tax=Spodoptera frugiperda TaxID=7108 RepID=A0A2H1VB16_SPOFR
MELENDLTSKFLSGEMSFAEYSNEWYNMDDEEDIDDASKRNDDEPFSFSGKGMQRRRKFARLPPGLLGLMGEANLRFVRGDRDTAEKMCHEIIKQFPTAPEPYQTLAQLYEHDTEKSLQFSLLAAHLSPPDAEEWLRLAAIFKQRNDCRQEMICYTQAIADDPHNFDSHLKRIDLLDKLEAINFPINTLHITKLKCYHKIVTSLPASEGETIMKYAKLAVTQYHNNNEMERALAVMSSAYKKCPTLFNLEDLNIFLELLIGQKQFQTCIEIFVANVGVEIEAEIQTVKNADGEIEEQTNYLNCTIPDSLPIDLKSKLLVCFIHLGAVNLVQMLLTDFLNNDVENAGDLYMDIEEALSSTGQHELAIQLLEPLVKNNSFDLGAVWLKHAECLYMLGRETDAINSFYKVLIHAPQHPDARRKLYAILEKKGRIDEALQMLEQDFKYVVNANLLYEQCLALKKYKKWEKYLEVGEALLSKTFVKFRHQEELNMASCPFYFLILIMANEVIPANEIKFEKFCNILEQLHKKKRKRQEQDKILENFIHECKLSASQVVGKKNATLFPILRLLLPKLDRERSAYNLKESKLGVLLVKVLSLCKQSRDAQKLLNYRSVDNTQDSDFPGVAYFVFKSRMKPKSEDITVGDINAMLDTIAAAEVGMKASVLDETFSQVMNKVTADQMKWFLRLILKELKLEMGSNRILALFHPDAPEYYETCSLLSKVCEELGEGDSRPLELGIELYHAISPMLSERLDVKNIAKQLSSDKTYQIENKFDGERFQIHMHNGKFEYYSRRGFSFTKNYGSSYDSGLLTPHLKDTFSPDVTSCILDGEMMGWHKQYQCFGCKGMAFDVKKITENSRFQPCFCAFDILYYNGRTLVGPPEKGGLPLRERLLILDKVFTDKTGVIKHSDRKILSQATIYPEILNALNTAIENQDEGIVVKDVDSYYIPNRRNAGWYKIKPEYTEGAMSDLDLVIIGADEAENKRQGRAKSFHVACSDGASPGKMPERWISVGRVSTGLTFDERETLCTKLEPKWTSSRQTPAPSILDFSKNKPDFWILPEHSVVLTVRASELVRTSGFGTDYTLRFPRVTKIRDDKPVQDVMTLMEFQNLCANKGPVVKLSTNQINGDEIAEVKPRAKRKIEVPKVPEQFQIRSRGDVEATSKALLGRKLCILSEDADCTRQELCKIIETHGGTVVANVGADTWCGVAGQLTSRVRNVVASNQLDVVAAAWLRALPSSEAPVQPPPLHMLAIKPATRLTLARHYDAHGDSYTEPIDEETLRKIFDKMDSDVQIYLTHQEMLNLDKEIFGDNNPHSFLRPCFIHVTEIESVNAIVASMYGANVLDTPSNDCTHIVVPSNIEKAELDTLKTYNVMVVSENWLEACFSEKKLVPEADFLM